jgi:hypothetical protein
MITSLGMVLVTTPSTCAHCRSKGLDSLIF